MRCLSCGHEGSDTARFCEQCGGRLGRVELAGERKHVTVLFADVKESMDLAAAMDAEDWQAIIDRFFSILSEGVQRFEGTVDKFTGDGIMALFGAPVAYEDHARQGCDAALHLREELAAYSDELRRARGLSFSVRIGLNSGEVVVGPVGAYTAVGHTVGLAARMEALAQPGTVCVTEHTAALVEGHFELRDLGPFAVKGAPADLGVYELVAPRDAQTTLEIAAAHGLSRFVGRDAELATLEAALERTLAGDAEVVAVGGEAGVGKSRLCHEFNERCCRARGIDIWRIHGRAHARAVPFQPLLELLRAEIAEPLAPSDDPLVADLLGVGDPGPERVLEDPGAHQRRLLGALNAIVRRSSAQQPSVWIVENLQWLDAGTAAFVDTLVDNAAANGALVILNHRDDARVPPGVSVRIALAPLDRQAMDLLLDDLLGAGACAGPVAGMIRARTGGNPFFIEEIARAYRETDELVVPPTVEAVIAARIDRLGEDEKAVLQTASVIGAHFSEYVLRRVSGLPAPALARALRALVAAEFVDRNADEYAFRHALTEEVAYRSQLAPRRAAVHAAVAHAIEEVYPERLDERAALLAHHAEAAGDVERAAHWSARAAVWARLKDPLEAMRHWRKARDLASPLEETEELVGLRVGAGWMILNLACRLGIAEGQRAEDFETEMAAVYTETRALADRHDLIGGRAVLASTYAAVRMLTGHLDESARHGREAIALAAEACDPALQVAVLPAPLYSLFVRGAIGEALAATEEGLRVAGDERALGSAAAIVSPHAWLLLMRGLLLGFAGEPAAGARAVEDALRIAREDGDVETEAFSHMTLVRLCDLAGSTDGALEHAREGMTVAERSGGSFWRCNAHQCLALAHLLEGAWDGAVEEVARSLALSRERGVGLEIEPLGLVLLARAELGRGDGATALAAADAALALALARGAKAWELSARHQRARALTAVDPAGAAEELGRALALVETTGARGFAVHVQRDLDAIHASRNA